jgi:Ca2+-transporting ATPase
MAGTTKSRRKQKPPALRRPDAQTGTDVSHAHALAPGAVLRALQSDPARGLTRTEAADRLARHGPNVLRTRKPTSLLRIFLNQFESPVVLLLAAAAVIAFAFGEWKEAAAIIAVLAINSAIGFATEVRAVRSMESLRTLATLATRVRREGRIVEVPAEELVPGDIVVLEGGDIVTADLRLVEGSNMSADESTLTGESLAVAKDVALVAADAPLADRGSMVFKGTALTRGSGLGVVVSTGMETELGHISRLVEEARPEHSPLEKQLERMSTQLVWVTLLIVAIIAVVGVTTGKDLLLMVEAAIALAVAAIPEGLPIVATMALARGMWRMARQNALIERLSAVETLGATTVIFTDKTGTLTENRMVLKEIWLADARVALRQRPPRLLVDGKSVRPAALPSLERALNALVLCNNAELSGRGRKGTGDPLEVALLLAGRTGKKDRATLERRHPRLREVAFGSESKMMATVHRERNGVVTYVKGAPEALLEHATHGADEKGVKKLASRQKKRWLERTDELANQGMRVLAVAYRTGKDVDEHPYQGLVFLGLLALYDPPRRDIAHAIALCRNAGIRVIMITGDHAVTARNIAAAIGLSGPDAKVIEGRALASKREMSRADKLKALAADVFARVSPAQKLDLVALYQEDGHIVAMTGDGVNDAPALKKADIGVAMGKRGTQVAREAAAMVLRDDAFATIVAAIREGRVIFRNIQAFVTYLLSCNLSEILVVGMAIIGGLPLPLLPLQILFLNLVTDVFPAFALGIGEGEKGVLRRHPRDPSRSIITPQLWGEIAGHGLSITLATLAALVLAEIWLGLQGEQAVTVSFLTLALAQLWNVLNMRDPRDGIFVNAITRNPFIWAALALCAGLIVGVTYVPFTADLLQLHHPDLLTWGLVLAMSLVPVILGQAGKEITRLVYGRRRVLA